MADENIGKLVDDLARNLVPIGTSEINAEKANKLVKAGKAISDANPGLALHADTYQKYREVLKDAFVDKTDVLKPWDEFSEASQKLLLKTAGVAEGAEATVRDAAIKKIADDFNGAKTALTNFAADDGNKSALAELEKAAKKLGGMTGLMNAEGWTTAVQKNMTQLNGRPLQVAGRWGAVALGSVGIADGVFRNQTTDGDRSVVTRFGEIALCTAAVAAALLASRAHVRP